MTFLPIVARELRVASRRRGTYWLRSAAGLAAVTIGAWVFFVLYTDKPPHEVAMGLFCTLTGSAVLYSLLSGVRATADCLGEERREGTLGLLFLTDLKGYDIVLGKLVAGSLNAFYSVAAAVPMLAIPILMGGITLAEFGRMALVAVNTLFFSLSLGVFISSFTRSAQRSRVLTLVLLLVLAAVLPACDAVMSLYGKPPKAEWLLLLPSPGYAFYRALAASYKLAPLSFWISIATTHVLGWFALLLASIITPHTWQDRPAGVNSLQWRERWLLWTYGNMDERATFRQRLLDRNAFFWLAARGRLKPAAVWAFLGLVGCIWVWGLAKSGRDWLDVGVYLTTAIGLNLFLRCWFCAEATRQLAEDRKAGTLELLVTTPLSVREILDGQWLALQRQFLGPVLAVLGIECVFMFATLYDSQTEADRLSWAALYILGMLTMVMDLAALFWVSLWQALSARIISRATGGALARILVVPWTALACILLGAALATLTGLEIPDPGLRLFLLLWFVLGLAADLGFGTYARQKLLTEFRLAAQRRYDTPFGFWKRFVG